MEQFALFIGTLLQSRMQAQIFHWQTEGEGSLATHEALGIYYESIGGVIDKIVESVQGRYGIVRGYRMPMVIKEDAMYLDYFDMLCKFVEVCRKQVPQDSYIQNQIDEVVELIETTKFKLKQLR